MNQRSCEGRRETFDRLIKRTASAIAFCALILSAAESNGASEGNPTPSADVEAGKAIAAACASCHGPEGISTVAEVPHLAGQHADYIVTALRAYRDGQRTAEMMADMKDVAATLSDEDIVNVAVYLASLPAFAKLAPGAGKSGEAFVEEDPFAATKEATADCAGCHGEDGNSDVPGTPSLAGQREGYFIGAMKAYKEGSRADDIMQTFAEALSDADIETIAFYYAAAKPRRADTPVAGDPYAGRAPSAACTVCHGEDGNSKDPGMPRLAGLDAEYLETATKAYKDGTRNHTAMQDLAASLKESDIADLSAFYATKEPLALPLRKPLTIEQWVERCDRCHGPGGNSDDPRFPILAGQSEPYLVKALKLYHSSSRASSMMRAMSFPMGQADIEKLATYYAGQTAK